MSLQKQIDTLLQMHKEGKLGGEKMPEDENPHLPKDSLENYLYFTLPMALNYQRNSYKLRESAHNSYKDIETRDMFSPQKVITMKDEELRRKLTKHKVALQPNKQPEIRKTLCQTSMQNFNGDIRRFFKEQNFSILNIKSYIQEHKKSFPYLGGNKILNYRLYVMEQYTDVIFQDREHISIAPDTHVIQATIKLGLIPAEKKSASNIQSLVVEAREKELKKSSLLPIDIHTPLRLRSRGGFPPIK